MNPEITASNVSARFDIAMCRTPEVLSTYKVACQESEACMTSLQSFCASQIQTNKEFNLQTDLLKCTIQCGPDKSCKKQCSTKIL